MHFDQKEYQHIATEFFERLFPLCRSLTGEGNRKTLQILQELIPLKLSEIPSGTNAFDWLVPEEWNVVDAWVKNAEGKKIIDFKVCNVSLDSYSTPIHQKVSYQEFSQHLHTLPNLPEAVHYRTSYYKRNWGFCMSHQDYLRLDPNQDYEVFIDSTLSSDGSLTFADALHKGKVDDEILISTYCCHPSLANDNLSGLILATLLFKYISTLDTYYSYRLVIAPETLGVITYLFTHQEEIKKVLGGTVVTTVGGPGELGLKPSFLGNHPLDRLARQALNNTETSWKEYPFVPDGSDERQYSTPGFRIPVVSITKDKYYDYKEYHTSLDNLFFVTPDNFMKTMKVYVEWIHQVEMVRTYKRKMPYGEYQLGRRGLYPNLGGAFNQATSVDSEVTDKDVDALSWLMFGCDGKTDLLSISERSKLPLSLLFRSAERLNRAGLLDELVGMERP